MTANKEPKVFLFCLELRAIVGCVVVVVDVGGAAVAVVEVATDLDGRPVLRLLTVLLSLQAAQFPKSI